MSQVASPSANIHAHGRAHAPTTQSARSQDSGTPTLFDSLIADSADPAPAQGQPVAAKTDKTAGQADAAQPAVQNTTVSQPTPAKAGGPVALIDTQTPAPAADPATGAVILSKVGTAAKAATDAGQTDTGKPDAAKDQSKSADGTGQPAAQTTPAGPPVVAVAVVPTQTPPQPADKTPAAAAPAEVSVQGVAQATAAQPAAAQSAAQTADAAPASPSPVTGPAVDTTVQGATQPAPAGPAVIAETAAQKLAPFANKDKAEAAKPAASDGKAATPQTSPTPPDDQGIAPQPDPQPDSAAAAQADPKAAASDKTAAKPDTQPNHGRIDAGTTAKADVFATAGTDTGAGGQASANVAASATSAQAPTATNASTAPQAALPQTLSLPGLAIQIAGRAHAGLNNFQIRLDPPELGRIEVKLSVDRQGQVTSHLIADRTDTLDLLRRDAPGLQRALQDAGLKTAGDGLQFSLRDQSFNGQQNTGSRTNASQVVAVDNTLPVVEVAARGYTGYAGRVGGIDIRV